MVFSPVDSPSSGVVYKYPLTVTFTSSTSGAAVYYKMESLNESTIDQNPPNLLSPSGITLQVTEDVVIKGLFFLSLSLSLSSFSEISSFSLQIVFALKPGLRESTVTSATYQVSGS